MSFVGDIVGGILGKDAAKEQANATRDAAKIAAEQFKPFNVTTALGSTNVSGNAIDATLSEQAQGILDRYANVADSGLGETAGRFYDLAQGIAQRDEDRARLDTRNALFRAGRLGTHSGVRSIGEVETALANARLTRELGAMEFAANQRQSAFNNYALMAQIPASNLISASLNRNPAAAVAAQGMLNASYASGAANNAFTRNMASAASGFADATGATDWFNDQIGSIFNSGGTIMGDYQAGTSGGGMTGAEWSAFGF